MAYSQIDCFRDKHVLITQRDKLKIIYAPPDSDVTDVMKRIRKRNAYKLSRPVYNYFGGDVSYSIKGRFGKSVTDSTFIMIVKGKEQVLDIRYVFSIEKKSIWKSVKAGMIGFWFSIYTIIIMRDIYTGRSSNFNSNDSAILFTASVGAIYFAIFNNKLLFPPHRIDRGWKFKLKPQ